MTELEYTVVRVPAVAVGAITPADEVIAVARITPEGPPFDAGPERTWRLRGMSPTSSRTSS